MWKRKRSRWLLLVAVVLIVVVVLAFIVFSGSPSSEEALPGVAVGDEFIYDIKTAWSSNDPDATLNEYYVQLNTTEWYKITITDVNGSTVSLSTVWRFTNGTEVEGTSTLNVKTGTAYPYNAFWGVYVANLEVNDRIRPSGATQAVVNDTTTRDYASGTREINVVSLSQEYYDADDPTYSTTLTEHMNIKFDKQKGMLVEFHDISIYTKPSQTYTVSWILEETNVGDV